MRRENGMFLLQPRKTSEAQVLENLKPEKQVLGHVTRGIVLVKCSSSFKLSYNFIKDYARVSG